MATKSIYIETGAEVELPGMVAGDVIKNGDNLSISDSISGQVFEYAGDAIISQAASIG